MSLAGGYDEALRKLEQPFGARDRGGQAVDSAQFRLTLGTAPLAERES